MNRAQRRATEATAGKAPPPADRNAPKPKAPPPPPFPPVPVLASLLKQYGEGGVHVTAEALAELETFGVAVQSSPDGQGGYRLRAVATKEAPLIVVTDRLPPRLPPPPAPPPR